MYTSKAKERKKRRSTTDTGNQRHLLIATITTEDPNRCIPNCGRYKRANNRTKQSGRSQIMIQM